MGLLKHFRQTLSHKVGAMLGGFEGGLSARRLKTFHASRAHVNTLIQSAGGDMTAREAAALKEKKKKANEKLKKDIAKEQVELGRSMMTNRQRKMYQKVENEKKVKDEAIKLLKVKRKTIAKKGKVAK